MKSESSCSGVDFILHYPHRSPWEEEFRKVVTFSEQIRYQLRATDFTYLRSSGHTSRS
jgi:hypothetical protein